MGNITFKVDAQTGKAINGFLKIVDSQRKMERGFSRAMRRGRNFDRTLRNTARTLKTLTGGLIGTAGASMAIRSVANQLKYAREQTIGFEDEMTGLLSLGRNIDMIDQMKSKVLDLSAAFGTSRKSIADALFNLQSGSAGLSKTIQADVLKNTLELAKVSGTDLPIALNALLKSYRIYGSAAQNVNTIQNKLFKTSELAYMKFRDLAVFFPDLASAAKTFGFSLDEVGAAVITATQKLGRTRKTLTALRNVFVAMAVAEKKGVKMTDNFAKNLKILSQQSDDFLLKFSGKQTIAAVGALTDNIKGYENALRAMKAVQGDVVSEKLTKRLKDQAYAFSEITKSLKEMRKNITVQKDYAERWGKSDIEYNLRNIGIRKNMPEWAYNLQIPLLGKVGDMATVLSQSGLGYPFRSKEALDRPLEAGREALVNQYKKAGRTDLIEALYKKLGYEQKTDITNVRGLLRPEGYKYNEADSGSLDQAATLKVLCEIRDKIPRGSHSYAHPPVR